MNPLPHPQHPHAWLRPLFAASLLVLLVGCGGGTSISDDKRSPDSFIIDGITATGAPMSGAQVLMVDARGTEVCNTIASAEGRYSCSVAASALAPLVVSASKNQVTHYAPITQLNQGTANVTQLTTLIAAQISPTGQPQALAEQLKANNALFTTAQVAQAIAELRTALKPLLTQADGDINPLTGNFKADGSGHDRVLSALDVQIKPTATQSNITITLKTEVVPGTELPSLSYVSGQTPPALPASTTTAKLPALDEDRLVADYVQRLNACYGLPKSTRVAGDGVTVQAPTCRALFLGNDPANFKNDGLRVGPSGAFPGMFADSSTGVLFESVAVEFRYPGEQMRLLLSVTAPNGSKTWSRIRLQREGERLGAVGNQYNYRFWVRPWTEKRQLVNRPEFNYLSTGFNIQLDNVQDNGLPLFEKVIVSLADSNAGTPSFELRPSPSLSYLSIRIGQSQTPTNNVRIAGHFIDAGTSGQPSRLSPQVNGVLSGEVLVWFPSPSTGGNWTDAEIERIPELTRWKAEFHLRNGSVVTQYHETVTAPLTVAELQGEQWARLDDSTLNTLISQTRAPAGNYLLQNLSEYPVGWTVSGRARAPTETQTQGFWRNGNANTRFNDIKAVTSTSRQASVTCSKQGSLDLHCNGSLYGNSYLDGLALFAFDQREAIWASQNFTYLLGGFNR